MDERTRGLAFLGSVIAPIPFFWFITAKFTYGINKDNARDLLPQLIKNTFHLWPLYTAIIAAVIIGIAIFSAIIIYDKSRVYKGEKFKKVLRGTSLVRASQLNEKTRERSMQQLRIAGINIPTAIESYHFSIGGTTGTGKTTLFNEVIYSSILRSARASNRQGKDKRIVLDPNGTFLSNFYKPGDKILNPYDVRTEGWSFYNEIRQSYDFNRFSKSIIQKSESATSEEWLGYGRLLFRSVAEKLYRTNIKPEMREIFYYTNEVPEEDLKKFVEGTSATGLFTGNDRASASARFVLSDKLPPHFEMPEGDFSIRDWLQDGQPGTLFITWQEEMKEALKPLISCWMDCIFSIVLGMGQRSIEDGRILVFIDELESLDNLPNLSDALTKGRKSGLCVFAGYQSVSQLVHVYGPNVAETILADMRSNIVLAGSRLGEKTLDHMSKSLGEIEGVVARPSTDPSQPWSGGRMSESVISTRAVTTTEIAQLENLTGYVAFPGSLPVAKFKTDHVTYERKTPVPGIKLRDNYA